jgi:multidrug resistance efflux pump
MKEYTFAEAKMSFQDGKITLRTPTDIAANEAEQQAAIAAAKEAREKKAQSSAERQAEFRQKKKDAGWKSTYVDPETLKAADDLGGIEHVLQDRNKWMDRAVIAESEVRTLQADLTTLQAVLDAIQAQPQPRTWWRFWE